MRSVELGGSQDFSFQGCGNQIGSYSRGDGMSDKIIRNREYLKGSVETDRSYSIAVMLSDKEPSMYPA
jgi:hypothetical protein